MVLGLQSSICFNSKQSCIEVRGRWTSHLPGLPGLQAGARYAGSDLQGHRICSCHLHCGALPALLGGEGLVDGNSGPGTVAMLPDLMAGGSIRGPDSGLAALADILCPETHTGL